VDDADDVDDLIDRCRAKLGDPDGVYRPASFLRSMLVGGGLLLAGLAVGGLVIYAAPKLGAALGKLLVALPAVGGILLWHAWVSRGRAVLTYPDGLLPVGRGEVNWVPWEAVTGLQLRAKDGAVEADPLGTRITAAAPDFLLNTAKLTVRTGDDRPPVEVRPTLIGYDRLVVRVQVETFARRWPAVRGQYDAGEAVWFGGVYLHRDGLCRSTATLPWDRVKSVELKGGRVVVKRRGRWLAWAAEPLERVVNPHLFFALVAHARAVAAGESASPPPADDL
jgi:hypothetical protein